ncbi:hypothetical protein [Pseudorhodoferax soli]|uniref:Uncharacterized protein n=1 Tax=Pseudorhodoferax soli TaxID=545864 RepID=A0A368XQ79_9BURK|nr:hypothetical protein [Pseudorhodoferax soli]RCW69316.1 hypothetical protein DES41_106187 [Pseudorhodoferax soli]
MAHAAKSEVGQEHRGADSARRARPGPATAHGARAAAVAQAMLAGSPATAAQRQLAEAIHGSPAMVAQRRLLGGLFPAATQRRSMRPAVQKQASMAVNAEARLEHEADVMGARALQLARDGHAAPTVPPTQAAEPAAGPVLQGYFRVDHAQQAAANVQIASTLPAMEQHAGTNSYRDFAGNLNLVDDNPALGPGPTADLRISDDGRLAIEDVDLTGRQPRVFFADAALVVHANEQLRARGGADKLAINPANTVRVPDAANMAAAHQLVEVVPANFQTDMNCDAVALGLTGASDSTTDVKLGVGAPANAPSGARTDGVYDQLAHHVARGTPSTTAILNAHARDVGNVMGALHVPLPDPNNINNQVAHERAHPGGLAATMEGREQALGINAYADPDIGDMYGSMSLGALRDLGGLGVRQFDEATNQYMRASQESWGTHFGGVVMKSGGDHVTLENYNRKVEDAGVVGAAGDAAPRDRWYFQMYGSKRAAAMAVDPALVPHMRAGDAGAGVDQSWHHAWSSAPRPVINAVTAVIGKLEHPLNAAVTAALAHSGVAGHNEITRAHEVDIRINCTPDRQNQLTAHFKSANRRRLDAIGDLSGLRSTQAAAARELAGHAAILRVFATTNGDADAKFLAATAARNQLANNGAGSANNHTPANLVAALAGYGINALPAGV